MRRGARRVQCARHAADRASAPGTRRAGRRTPRDDACRSAAVHRERGGRSGAAGHAARRAARAAGGAKGGADPAAAARPAPDELRRSRAADDDRRCLVTLGGCARGRRAGQRPRRRGPPARRRCHRRHHSGLRSAAGVVAADAAVSRAHRRAVARAAARCRCWRSCCCCAAATSCSSPRPEGRRSARWPTGISVVNAADVTSRPGCRSGPPSVRTVACLGSVLALGAGFLLASSTAIARAFHDRVADTRVVARVTRLAVFIATVGYCGYFPIAPGTVGSAAGLLFYLIVWWAQSPLVEIVLILLLFARRRLGRDDIGALFRRHRSRADRGGRSRRAC